MTDASSPQKTLFLFSETEPLPFAAFRRHCEQTASRKAAARHPFQAWQQLLREATATYHNSAKGAKATKATKAAPPSAALTKTKTTQETTTLQEATPSAKRKRTTTKTTVAAVEKAVSTVMEKTVSTAGRATVRDGAAPIPVFDGVVAPFPVFDGTKAPSVRPHNSTLPSVEQLLSTIAPRYGNDFERFVAIEYNGNSYFSCVALGQLDPVTQQFILHEGTVLALKDTHYLERVGLAKARKQFVRKFCRETPHGFILKHDHLFSSPSKAAAFVMGTFSLEGNEWHPVRDFLSSSDIEI